MFLIGIAGLRNSGKDTAARLITETWSKNRKVVSMAFADPMKRGLMHAFDIASDDLWGDSARREKQIHDIKTKRGTPFTIRYALQTFGDKIGRETWNRDIWIQAVSHDIDQIQLHEKKDDPDTFVVVSDVRRVNEAKAIFDRGGMIIRLHRGIRPQLHRLFDVVPFLYLLTSIHTSEREVHTLSMNKYVTDEIRNDEPISNFRENLQSAVFRRFVQSMAKAPFKRKWIT